MLLDSYSIMKKDLLETTRNRMSLVLMIVMPMLLLAMFGFIYPNTAAMPQDLPVAIIDLSHSDGSANFVAQLQAMNNNSVKMDFRMLDSVDDARASINRGEIYGAIIIPADFATLASQGKTANVTVLYDNSNPMIGSETLGEASGLISGMSGMQSAANIAQLGAKANVAVDPQAVLNPYSAQGQGTTPGTNYFNFLAPGMLIMSVMMSAMTGIPEGISQEKERGTFDGVLSAPINPISIIIGKTVALTLTGFIQGILVIILAVIFFGVTIQGSILLVFFLLFLGVFSFIGLGILFTSIAGDQKNSIMLINLLMFPMMFLSGVMFPVQQMPWFLQWISQLIPVTYAADAMRKVMILNAGIQDVLLPIAILVVFGIITMAIALPVFKRSMTR
jgi:ABC-2 type transport system permease protein